MKKQNLIFYISILLFITLLYSNARAPETSESAFALVNGMLIDGTGAPPLLDAVLIVEDEHIKDVGHLKKIAIPEGAKVIDVEGHTLIPGFINAHVHKGYNEHNLKTWAKNGVTTVRDLGGNPRNKLFAFRDRVNEDPKFARLVAAGPMVTVPGGYPKVPWGSPSGLPVTSPDEAKEITNFLLDDGANIIKIALESGRSFGRKIPMLSLDEAKAIVAVAHHRKTIVSAHVLVSEDLEHALNAGVDDIAHMVTDNPSDELIDRVVKQGVYWIPTLELWHGVNPRLRDIAIRNLHRFVKAGGLVALGTDYAGYRSRFDLGMPIREIRWMKEAGMTPMQIIVASTKNAAHVCNLGDKIGTLEKGKIADVLIVKGNPLEDLEALLRLRLVIHNGEIIREVK
ncbi:MAG: amidohydrolase family protein [Candidatus Aminicenantes bacterium]|jgi:imidazolonepropionase-like amidohydrolase